MEPQNLGWARKNKDIQQDVGHPTSRQTRTSTRSRVQYRGCRLTWANERSCSHCCKNLGSEWCSIIRASWMGWEGSLKVLPEGFFSQCAHSTFLSLRIPSKVSSKDEAAWRSQMLWLFTCSALTFPAFPSPSQISFSGLMTCKRTLWKTESPHLPLAMWWKVTRTPPPAPQPRLLAMRGKVCPSK